MSGKIVSYKFSEYDFVDIWFMYDIHLGLKECDESKFDEYIAWLKAKENRFAFGGGDYIENVIIGTNIAKTGMKTQIYEPDEQVKRLIKKLEPVKHKIKAMIHGNHEFRSYIHAQNDRMTEITNALGCDYLGGHSAEADIKIYFSKYKNHLVHMEHGKYAGDYVLNKMRLNYWKRQMMCDVYVMGHSHQLDIGKLLRETQARNKLSKERIYLVSAGSLIDMPAYAKRMGCIESEVGNPIIRFYRDKIVPAYKLEDIAIWRDDYYV